MQRVNRYRQRWNLERSPPVEGDWTGSVTRMATPKPAAERRWRIKENEMQRSTFTPSRKEAGDVKTDTRRYLCTEVVMKAVAAGRDKRLPLLCIDCDGVGFGIPCGMDMGGERPQPTDKAKKNCGLCGWPEMKAYPLRRPWSREENRQMNGWTEVPILEFRLGGRTTKGGYLSSRGRCHWKLEGVSSLKLLPKLCLKV